MPRSATENSSIAPRSIRGLTITGKNVRYENDSRHFTVTSITFGELTSCAAAKRSYEVFLALAILVFVGGIILAMYDPNDWGFYFVVGSIITLALVFLFFVTRSTVLEFCSQGGAKIAISTGNLTPGEIIAIIDKVETAKESFHKSAAEPGNGERRPPPRQAPPVAPPGSPAPAADSKTERSYWIARNGQEEGPLPVSVIKERRTAGTLTGQDYFLDPKVNEWVSLDRFSALEGGAGKAGLRAFMLI